MQLYVKNMVCPRCITVVSVLLERANLRAKKVELGEVDLVGKPTKTQLQAFNEELIRFGFSLLEDGKGRLIEEAKNFLIRKVQAGKIEKRFNIAGYLKGKVPKGFSSLSRDFSSIEGITIEQFFILQKIEKAKEWLMYNEKSIGEIAFDLGYSSAQHLSAQFRNVTGMTASQFRQVGTGQRKSIDLLSN